MTQPRPARQRAQIAIAYLGFVLLGITAGGGGVLLPEQIADFGVDKAGIGWLFITGSAGYVTSAVLNGPLTHLFGTRTYLISGIALTILASGVQASRPPFVAFVLLQFAVSYGIGSIDAGLNAFLSTFDRPTPLLNALHGCFGAGAIIGPIMAAAMVSTLGLPWNLFLALFAVLVLPLLVGVLLLYPGGDAASQEVRPTLGSALGLRVVWLAGGFLAVYVGLEVGLGNWGFSFLREDRGQGPIFAGWVMSGYWTGLTIGRFVLARIGERFGVTGRGLNGICLVGVGLGTALVWAVPSSPVAAAGFGLIGFFLGPLFPTMIAVMPRLTPARLVATAIGIGVGLSALGGAVAPWIAGAVAQHFGAWSLLPFSLLLTGVLGVVWWRVAVRLADRPVTAVGELDALPAEAT